MLSIPDRSDHRTKIADWLELKALSSPDRRVGFGTLTSASSLIENDQNSDVGDEDRDEEAFVLCVQGEIARRLNTVGDDYPFRIDDKGRSLQYVTPVSRVGSVYLFCLFLSHASDRTVVSQALAPDINNRVRDLFQACATIAAGGYVEGPAMSFGFPRPDGATFLDALHQVYALFGDGKPHKTPRVAASAAIKDNGIDVIAWKRPIDRLPGTHYLIGQVASGKNWADKSVRPDREHFHDYWFVEKPGSQPEDAMFIPFGLEPENARQEPDYEKLLSDHVQSILYRYGTLFYRERIARFLARGLQLIAAGERHIQREADLKEVTEWVDGYTKRLRAA